MATCSKRTLEERAARIRAKSDMLLNLPCPKEDEYGSAMEYARANRWNFNEEDYNSSEDLKKICAHDYANYKMGIQAFNDILDDLYSVLE